MPASNNEIFFSYAWGDDQETGQSREKLVDDLYTSLKNDGYQVIRDKYDLGYKGFISDFMARIGEGQHIIIVISQKYLRSPYCMFELYEIARNANFNKNEFSEKAIPIMETFIDFSKPTVLEGYFAYWQEQFNEWDQLVKNRSGSLSTEQFQRYDKIKMVWQNFGKLADWLVDMNSLNPALLSKDNFDKIKSAIGKNIPVADTRFPSAPAASAGHSAAADPAAKKNPSKINAAVSILAIAIIAVLFFMRPHANVTALQNISVFVHGKKGKQDMILRKQGYVVMDVSGGERKKADINENGVAYFQNLRIGDSVRLEVDFSEPYKSTSPDAVFIVSTDGRFYLPVELQGIDKVKGVVIFNDAPIAGVTVTIDNHSDTTDINGHYQLDIPEKEQKQQYTVWFNKPGFKIKSAPAYPQTGQDLNILMEK
ncbi:MAG: TIR domain-containing protein [Chitinophagaceae bacterium]